MRVKRSFHIEIISHFVIFFVCFCNLILSVFHTSLWLHDAFHNILNSNVPFCLSTPWPPVEKQGRAHLVSIKKEQRIHTAAHRRGRHSHLVARFPNSPKIHGNQTQASRSWVNIFLFPRQQTSGAAAECFLFWTRNPHICPSLQRLSLKMGSEVKVSFGNLLGRAVKDNNGNLSENYWEKLTSYQIYFLLHIFALKNL